MNTLEAFANGEAHRGCEAMVFDWNKAAKIIRERKPIIAYASLKNDWEHTGGVIYASGRVIKGSYTFLKSTWATPLLIIDGEIIDCFVMESETKWNENTKWPKSAIDILLGPPEKFE